jgi:sec-independent protein translocase protein TatB|tara:strand:+ start:290 stop:601 length:312 start_codon:yes stop_codon:yes gene_type:complete
MFDFGFWELIVVVIVALLVFGPEKLPELATKAGKWTSKGRQTLQNIKYLVEKELHTEELKEELDDLSNVINETKKTVKTETLNQESLLNEIENRIKDTNKKNS